MTKLGLFCERMLEAGWLVAVVTIPMYFNIYSNRVFEPDKIITLRSLVAVMALFQLIKWLETLPKRGEAPQKGSDPPADQSPRLWWRWWRSNPLAVPALLVVATYLIGTLVSVSPGVSIWGSYQRLQGTYSMFSYIMLFFLMVANLRRKEQIDRLFTIILLASLPISLYGLVQHSGNDPLPWGGDVVSRVTSTMGNPIFLAAYLIMVVPITLQRLIGSAARVFASGQPANRSSLSILPKIVLLAETPVVAALMILSAQQHYNGLWWFPLLAIVIFAAISLLIALRQEGWSEGWESVLLAIGLVLVQVVVLAAFTKWSADQQSQSMWWAALPVMAMFAALSFMINARRRTLLTTVSELQGYSLLLAVQMTAIVLSDSRGPEIGLMAGLACFAVVLAIRRRAWKLLGALSTIGIIGIVFLVVFNIPGSPLASLRDVQYFGRLGRLLETDQGTGRVRVLIWSGTTKLLTTRPPVGLDSSDPLGPARLLTGYGPESMYVVYNKVYPADLAHWEARNASPDRNHDDVLDFLVNVGVLGLLAYFFLLGSVFYLIWKHLLRAHDLAAQLSLVGLMSVLVAHVVESLTGIVIAATWTYFWVYLAVVAAAALIYRTREQPAAAAPSAAMAELLVAGAPSVSSGSSSRTRRRAASRPAHRTSERRESERAGGGKVWARGVPYPAIAFVVVVLLTLLCLKGKPPVEDTVVPLVLGFFVFLLGAASIALSLGKFPAGRSWRPEHSWIYAIGVVVVGILVVVFNLDAVAADINFKRGFSADQIGQYDVSIANYNKALRLAGDQDFYYLFLGRAYLELSKSNQRPKAAPDIELTIQQLLSMTPADIGKLGREDRMALSKLALNQARSLSPLNTDHYANLGRLYRTWAEMGDPTKLDQADQYYKQATTLSPQAAHLFDEWAQVDLDRGQKDAALEKVKKAADIDARYAVTFVLMGDIYQNNDQPGEAVDAHQRAIKIDPASLSDQRFDQRMSSYEKAGMLGQMEIAYAAVVQSQPRSAAARAAYGFILFREGKNREALAEFQTSVKLTPADWIAHRNLALVNQVLGNIEQAITSVQAALRYAPTDQQSGLQNLISDLQKKR